MLATSLGVGVDEGVFGIEGIIVGGEGILRFFGYFRRGGRDDGGEGVSDSINFARPISHP